MFFVSFGKMNLLVVTSKPVLIDFDVVYIVASSACATSIVHYVSVKFIRLGLSWESQLFRYVYFVF